MESPFPAIPSSFQPAPQLNPLVQEINVVGERAEEACDHVEKFLDNAVMATAADYVIAEVEQIVDLGALDPNYIHTPGIFVHRLVHIPHPVKRIEKKTTREG